MRLPTRLLISTLVIATSSTLSAQSLFGFDGATGEVVEFTGPPSAANCGYPSGPLIDSYPVAVPFVCPTVVAPGAPPSLLGDVAVDLVNDTTWVTDGITLTEYDRDGAIVTSHPIPPSPLGPITGLGYNSSLGILWATDGTFATGIVKPNGCFFPGVIVFFPFLLPLTPGATVTDIEWDPMTGTLWVCDDLGMVTNVLPGGGLGPMGSFVGTTACGLGPALHGLAIDYASTTPGTMYVTDGAMVAYVDATGASAPLTIYTTASCFAAPGGALVGLAGTAHGISFGSGTDSSGLNPPNIGSRGHSIVPSPAFETTLSGAPPGSFGVLFASFGALCPTVSVAGLPVHIGPSPLIIVGTTTTDGSGSASTATPIPLGTTVGIELFFQWAVLTTVPSRQVTPGLALTVSPTP